MAEIQSVKKEFCNNVATVEKFVPNPHYPVDLELYIDLPSRNCVFYIMS